jgi:Leucine-rich repeat (LRR) protein
MYFLPPNLEFLNLSYNSIKSLKPEVTATLKNLITFDVSNNRLECLNGIENMKRLKRILSKNNKIAQL